MQDLNQDGRNFEQDAWEDIHSSSGAVVRHPSKPRKLGLSRLTSKKLPFTRRTKATRDVYTLTDRWWILQSLITPYILDVSKNVFQLLRRPLSFILCLWFLVWLLGRMSITAKAAFSSFCFLPGISRVALCLPTPGEVTHGLPPPPKWADFPALMTVQDNAMAQLLDENSSGSALALHIKKAKMATSDLAILVRYSNLKSRDRLADHLETFAQKADSTSNSLTDLSSKVSGAVDSIMGVNDYALKTIEAAQQSTRGLSILYSLNPWPAPAPLSVTASFETSMQYLSTAIRRLVVEFEANIRHLNDLEQELAILHDMVSREGIAIDSARSELLGQLWTLLGGNRRQLSMYNFNLQLLINVSEYRKQALAHVVSALQKLRQMGGDVEDLRRRVSEPELIGGRIPVDVHIRSIQRSLKRLKESQVQARAREEVVLKEALSN